MLRGFRFVRRRDLGKFEDSALSSLLLPVRGFLLLLLHLLLLRLVCEQERKKARMRQCKKKFLDSDLASAELALWRCY